MPIRVTSKAALDRESLLDLLRTAGVMPRRYFYPLIPEFQYYQSNSSADPVLFPEAVRSGLEVICLPIYPDLSDDLVRYICRTMRAALNV